jgi:hypothetical protein
MQRRLSKLLGDRRGTAEIIGSVMFLVILLFVFSNVYLWHDSATREMNTVLAEKMNSGVSIDVDESGTGLLVTNNGGFEVCLSRLWLITESIHYFADLEPYNVRVAAGGSIHLVFGSETLDLGNGEIQVLFIDNDEPVVCKILTSLGNMAACTYTPESA